MAEEFQIGSGNWWESTRTSSSSNRFESGSSSSPSSSITTMALNNTSGGGGGVSYGWQTQQQVVDMKQQGHHSDSAGGGGISSSGSRSHLLIDPNLQMMGLGLSPQPMDWNQPIFPSEKVDVRSYREMIQQEDHELSSSNTNTNTNTSAAASSTTSHFQQEQWRPRLHNNKMMYSSTSDGDSSRGGGFSIEDQSSAPQLMMGSNPHTTATATFQMDSTSCTSTVLPVGGGLFGYEINDHQPQQQLQQQSSLNSNYSYHHPLSYTNINTSAPPEHQPLVLQQQQPPPPPPPPPQQNTMWSTTSSKTQNQLHFTNNTPFWNASNNPQISSDPMGSGHRNSINVFPSIQMQQSPSFDEKPKKSSSSSSEPSTKRPRNETSTPLPAFKVRKEKMGDRITALQQLVSPFGKTDTASVLSEAIEYIKFLHQQVSELSSPYMKSGVPIQQQKNFEKSSKDGDEAGAKQNLRSKGLCLVPVSSTFPVTHETTVDFWNPTFGGTFR